VCICSRSRGKLTGLDEQLIEVLLLKELGHKARPVAGNLMSSGLNHSLDAISIDRLARAVKDQA